MEDKNSLLANIDLPSDQIINVESFSELQRYEEELTDIQFLTKSDEVLGNTPKPEMDYLTREITEKIPSSYKNIAWLSCLFCCVPLAAAAVWKSKKVVRLIQKGDLRHASIQSKITKKLTTLAIIFGIILIVLCIVIYLLRNVK